MVIKRAWYVLAVCILASAAVVGADVPSPAVVGHGQELSVIPDLSSSSLVDGERIWSRAVTIEGATFLKPHFVGLDLRDGDQLVVRSKTGHVVEILEGRGPKGQGTFWGLSAFGDELHIELRFAADYALPPFEIDEVIVGDIDPMDSPESICWPPDFEDVICYDNDPGKWANVMASVGVMSVGSNPTTGLWCSGSNVSPDNAILTNDHCVGTNCLGAEFVFKYYNQVCGGGYNPTGDWQSFRGDQVLANSPLGSCTASASTLDFTLCSVQGDPASTFGWVTPDPNPVTNGEGLYIVQHPAGRPHEITHGSGVDVFTVGVNLYYDETLDTEGGSSGSPVFRESDDKLVGLHHCGGCPNSGMMMSDIYPHIEAFLDTGEIFTDGFEDGTTNSWDMTSP
jgi:V8-like Glu-specific endopeptidase